MNEFKTLSERLRYAMEILPPKKIKGVDLARAVGVKPPSVSDWLSGKSRTMEGENLLKASNFLKVNPVWLASGTGKIQPQLHDNSALELMMMTTSSRSKALEQLIQMLDKFEAESLIGEAEIELLAHTVDIIGNKKKGNIAQFQNEKKSIFKE